MKKGDYISAILRSDKTVFSFKDIALLWEDSGPAARVRVNYYIKKGDIFRIRRGFYAKDKNYDRLELATRIFTPSYVSFETVLGQAGIIFQYHSRIFSASYLTREITADNQQYFYRKIKNFCLADNLGIESKDQYSIASAERAFLDMIYINRDYYFDNLSSLSWNKVFQILPIYENKRMAKKVEELHRR
jgi:hypothetical protein